MSLPRAASPIREVGLIGLMNSPRETVPPIVLASSSEHEKVSTQELFRDFHRRPLLKDHVARCPNLLCSSHTLAMHCTPPSGQARARQPIYPVLQLDSGIGSGKECPGSPSLACQPCLLSLCVPFSQLPGMSLFTAQVEFALPPEAAVDGKYFREHSSPDFSASQRSACSHKAEHQVNH